MALNASTSSTMAQMANTLGGYSVFPGKTGTRPAVVTDRYMVGGVVPTKIVSAPIGNTDVYAHYSAHHSVLEDPNMAMGAWYDKEGGNVELDVSETHTRDAAGQQSARRATVDRNEIAYGEVGHDGGYEGEHANPFSTRRMGIRTDASGRAEDLTLRASRQRAAHFRTGINSETLATLMGGGAGAREAGKETWVRTGPPSDPQR